VSGNGQVGTLTLIKANGGPLVTTYYQNISKHFRNIPFVTLEKMTIAFLSPKKMLHYTIM
jgi:hypothetical protein